MNRDPVDNLILAFCALFAMYLMWQVLRWVF